MDYLVQMQQGEDALPGEDNGSGRTIRAPDLLARRLPSPFVDGTTFGPWRFDATELTLTHEREGYEIDLEELDSAGALLDTLLQVSENAWCSREDAGLLLSALTVLLDPQERLCSFGGNRRSSATGHLREQIAKTHDGTWDR